MDGADERMRREGTISMAESDRSEYSFRVEVQRCEEGGWFGKCPEIPGCVVQGETYDETLSELKCAIEAMIEDYAQDGEEIPFCEIDDTKDTVRITCPIFRRQDRKT